MLDRARKLFGEQVGQSYSLDLNDLSRENWNLVPPIGDLLVDMDLARFGQISYARSGGDSEDISLLRPQAHEEPVGLHVATQPRDARHAPLQRRGSPRLRRRPVQRGCVVRSRPPLARGPRRPGSANHQRGGADADASTRRAAGPARGDLRRVRPAARLEGTRTEQHRRQPARLTAPRADASPARLVRRAPAARATGAGGHHGGAADAFGNGARARAALRLLATAPTGIRRAASPRLPRPGSG